MFSSMIIVNVHLIIMQCIIPKSKVVIVTSIVSIYLLSPPTAAHRLNILVKFFGPAGVQTPVYKQCTNLQIFRYLDRQKTGRQKKMAARTICGGYATIECYLKLTSPGSGLSCLPWTVSLGTYTRT